MPWRSQRAALRLTESTDSKNFSRILTFLMVMISLVFILTLSVRMQASDRFDFKF